MGTGLPVLQVPPPPPPAAPSKTSRGKLSARLAVKVESPPWLGFSFLSRLVLTDPINPGVHSSRGPSSHSPLLPGLETTLGPYELALVLAPVTILQHNNLLTKTPTKDTSRSQRKVTFRLLVISMQLSLQCRQGEL